MAQQEFNTGPGRSENTGSRSEKARDKADQAMQTAKDKTDDAMHKARHQAGELADRAREQATTQLSSQKEKAAESLGSVSKALRQTGSNLRNEHEDTIAQYIDRAAEQVDHFSQYLRQRTVGDLLQEAEDLARRQPGLFFGGAMLLGLIGARFLKSSSPGYSYEPTRRGYAGQYGYRGQYGYTGEYGYEERPYEGTYRSSYERTASEREYPRTGFQESTGSQGWSSSESSRIREEGKPVTESSGIRDETASGKSETTADPFREERTGGRRDT